MRWFLMLIWIVPALRLPAAAMDLEAPAVPDSAGSWMPGDSGSFADGLAELGRKALAYLGPEVEAAAEVCRMLLVLAVLLSLVSSGNSRTRRILLLTGTVAAGAILFREGTALIRLSAATVRELSDYGKLFFPVMAAAMAAQGGVTASSALYVGTLVFDALLGNLLSRLLIPSVYCYLAMSLSYCATGQTLLKRIRDLIRSLASWLLKTLLTVFVTYMSITGVVSGTTDAAALKATKVTISTVVPVVGGILSDASEAVLTSAGLLKSSAGIYGILAFLAVFLAPFLTIGVQYLILKLTGAVCAVFTEGGISALVDDFSEAMGLLLAMTGACCLLLLISTVCFMKGVG